MKTFLKIDATIQIGFIVFVLISLCTQFFEFIHPAFGATTFIGFIVWVLISIGIAEVRRPKNPRFTLLLIGVGVVILIALVTFLTGYIGLLFFIVYFYVILPILVLLNLYYTVTAISKEDLRKIKIADDTILDFEEIIN